MIHDHPFHRADRHARLHIGSFPGERASRIGAGFDAPAASFSQDTSSLLSVAIACAGVFAFCVALVGVI